jgi:2-alkyl-3-oxoalkanoate reductase
MEGTGYKRNVGDETIGSLMTRNPLRILVTGAGGLLGSELSGALAERGHAVVAMLHHSTAMHRNDGRPLSARPWDGTLPLPGELAALRADVRQPGLGLDRASLAEIVRGLDLVIHGAAATGFNLSERMYREVNIGGTANVLALIGQGGKAPIPLLHLSTAYVCGERSGPVAEGELDVGQRFANGYESSKAEAERLVHAARQQGGISAVARPSIVVGRYCDGTIGQFTDIYALIRLVTGGRIRVLPGSPCASLDLVPIDHVIGGLTDIAERMAAASGRTYHLVSGTPVPLAALRTLALGYQHLHAPRFVPPETFERTRLTRAEQTFDRRVTSLYASYLQRDPWFQDANLRALSGRTCPRPDQAFLQRLMDYGIATGYLRGRTVQRTSG